MTELSPEARALIEGAREVGGPSAQAKAGMKQALSARIAAEPVVVAAKVATGGAMIAKGVVVVAVVGALWRVIGGDGEVVAPAAAVVPVEAAVEVAEPVPLRVASSPVGVEDVAAGPVVARPAAAGAVAAGTAAPVAAGPAAPMAPAPVAAGLVAAASRPSRAPRGDSAEAVAPEAVAPAAVAPEAAAEAIAPASPPPIVEVPPSLAPSPSADDRLAAELRLISGAEEALARGRLDDARAALARHATEHPGGLLQQERRALEILLDCATDASAAARARATTFVRTHPGTPFARRIDAACGR